MMRLAMVFMGVLSVLVGPVSADSMPLPLKVVGAQVLNSKGEPVILRGVNCASLEWTSDGEGHIVESVRVAIDDWRVNHVRLPMSQDRWFGKAPEQKDEGKAYRALVKEIVDLCASKGVYILLDLHWSNVGEWGRNIGQHSMPDENSLAFWKDIAPVYANHPAVIYDLYNEPHDVSWDIWLNGGMVTDRPNSRKGGEPKTFKAIGMQALQDHNWSWTAWDFHPSAGPTLIADWNYTPTPDFGVFVKQMLVGALPRYTPPATPTP